MLPRGGWEVWARSPAAPALFAAPAAGLALPQLPPGALRDGLQDAPAGQAGDPRERRRERAHHPAGRAPPRAQPVAAERAHPPGLAHAARRGWRATPTAAQGEPKPEKGPSGPRTPRFLGHLLWARPGLIVRGTLRTWPEPLANQWVASDPFLTFSDFGF